MTKNQSRFSSPAACRRMLMTVMGVWVLCVCAIYGQVAGTGNIQGSVADPTGAMIPGAKVTLTNTATQVTRDVTTDSSGLYVYPNIPIGTYTVSVTAPGFKSYQQSNVVLEVGSSIAVNAKMQLGTADQKVEVTTDQLALQTEDVSFKQTIDQATVTEMPLNGRQMTQLITLSGGSTAAPNNDIVGSKSSYASISVSIAGGGGNTTLWRLDGGDHNDYMTNTNLPFPFPDAVSQFSVESTALGAQDGMHSGGLVNVVTRSGTNSFHGSAFEFIRNNYLDATNFFSTQKDQLHQNQFGGTFGGPVWIPHLYNGKDRLFFFAGYQRTIIHSAAADKQAHVPTALNLAGDYSVTDPILQSSITSTSCATKAVQLLDPLTGAPLPGNKYATAPTYNAQALNLQKYLPAIDPAVDINNCGLVSYSIPAQTSINDFVTRIDYTINPKNHLYGSYYIDGYQNPAVYTPTNILVTTQYGNVERVQTGTIGEDWTINSNTVNSAHATVMRRVDDRGYAPGSINATAIGVNVYQALSAGLYLAVSNKFTMGGGLNSLAHFNDNTLSLGDEVTMIRGKHQLVFGGEYVRNQLNIGNGYEGNGVFTFSGTYSGSGPNSGKLIGDGNLDFLQGAMSAFQQSKEQQNALRAPIPSIYGQDTYHASARLTVVAGLRWSPEFMPVDYFNRGTTFDMNAFLANQVSTIYPNSPAGSFYYGDPGVPRGFTQNSPWQFSPNLGAAYDVSGNGRTVVRVGGELIYDEVNFFTGQRTQQNPPFATAISQTQTTTSGPMSFSNPWSVGAVTTSPFPQPAVPTPAQAQFFPQSQFIVLPKQFKPSYTTQWTASVQHQFSHGWQLQLDYIGNKTTHAPLGIPLSPAVYVPGVWGAGGTGCAGVVTTGPAGKPAGAAGTPCSTTANQSQRFYLTEQNPLQGNGYLGGGGGSSLVGDGGMSNYNGLVTTVQHRLASDFQLLANWTWSKCMNLADSQGDLAGTTLENPNNPALDYGPCGSDYRHVENVSVVATSHFAFSNKLERAVLNGWEIAPLAHIVSGAPFTVTTGTDVSLTDVGHDRPNVVPGVPIYTHIANRSASGAINRAYLNPAAFCGTSTTASPCPNPVAAGSYGNVSRNSYRGLPNYEFDSQISRIFPIHDTLNLVFRLEAFNVLNHPNFGTPSAGLTSSTLGQISSAGDPRLMQGSIKINF